MAGATGAPGGAPGTAPPDERELARLPVLYTLPGTERVAVRRDLPYKRGDGGDLLMDLYRPPDARPGERRPAVIFVHGGPLPAPPVPPKDRGRFTSWGRLVAAAGLVGVTFNHRHRDWTTLQTAAGDVEDLLDHVRSRADDLGIDPDRLAVSTASGGPMVALRRLLREGPASIRCVVVYYGGLDLQHRRAVIPPVVSDAALREFSPLYHLEQGAARVPPLFLARAGRDSPRLNDSIDRFVAAALARNAPLTLVNHPEGRHGFDLLDDGSRTREIIRSTLAFLQAHLGVEQAAFPGR